MGRVVQADTFDKKKLLEKTECVLSQGEAAAKRCGVALKQVENVFLKIAKGSQRPLPIPPDGGTPSDGGVRLDGNQAPDDSQTSEGDTPPVGTQASEGDTPPDDNQTSGNDTPSGDSQTSGNDTPPGDDFTLGGNQASKQGTFDLDKLFSPEAQLENSLHARIHNLLETAKTLEDKILILRRKIRAAEENPKEYPNINLPLIKEKLRNSEKEFESVKNA